MESIELTPVVRDLSSFILTRFQEARNAKEVRQSEQQPSINERLVNCLQRYRSEYSTEKLREILEVNAPPVYIPLTSIKVRALTAWLVDIFFQPASTPYEITPTPVPDIPESIKATLQAKIMQNIFGILQTLQNIVPPETLVNVLQEVQEMAEKEYKIEIEKYAKKNCERIQKAIEDVFIEGGFYKALSDVCEDIAIFPTAILKGGVLRMEKGYYRTANGYEPVDKAVYSFNRVSPFNAFPSPRSSNFDDYFIEVLNMLPEDLYRLIGMEGYDSDAIRKVLRLHSAGYELKYSNYSIQREALESKISTSSYPFIDVIEFWGTVQGDILSKYIPNIDKEAYYNVTAWLVDDIIIKAIMNPDPLGKKPYAKASFINIPDSFWGIALPEVLSALQDSVNAFARASILNSAFGSGVIVERDIDRIDPSEVKTLIPFHIYDVRGTSLNASPAYRFNEIPFIADRIVNVLLVYMKMADEISGVPAYAHGDITVGGAGRTATGLSMLTANATRGIKAVVRNIDSGIIEPLVERQYYNIVASNMFLKEFEIADLKIQAKGSVILGEKEIQATRALEFLRLTADPVSTQILGIEGRKNLLETIAKSIGIDVDKVFPTAELGELNSQLQAQLQQYMSQQKSPENQPQDIAVMKGMEVK